MAQNLILILSGTVIVLCVIFGLYELAVYLG